MAKGEGIDKGRVNDLVKGLRLMADVPGCYHQLKQLEHLVQWIDDSVSITVEEGHERNWQAVVTYASWQEKLIDDVRHILEAQDAIIMQLQSSLSVSHTDYINEEKFEPDVGKLAALRSLTNLFFYNHHSYAQTTGISGLKAWALAHDVPFDTVRNMLAMEEEVQP